MHNFTPVTEYIIAKNIVTAKKHIPGVIAFTYFVQESKHAARTAPVLFNFRSFYSYNFLIFSFREKLAIFLCAPHTARIIVLLKHLRRFNYLINLRDM